MGSLFGKGMVVHFDSIHLEELKNQLVEIGLYRPVWVVQYGIPTSHFYFFTILEIYNVETCTYFPCVGEMGLALHEL